MYDVWVSKTNILKNHTNQDLDKRLLAKYLVTMHLKAIK